jgi:ubiquinone/menaquinone biosynthesis C-methylase UbiE
MRLRIFPEPNRLPAGGDLPAEATDRLYHREAFRKPPRRGAAEAFTPAWFECIENERYRHQGYWLPRVLEFAKHGGEVLLAMGEGLGTDWLQYAKYGTEVIAYSPSQEQLDLIRSHFDLRGLPGRFVHGPPHALPLADNSVDVVCINGMLDEVEDPAVVVAEVYRILRPGGKCITIAPAKFCAKYWSEAFFPWRRWFAKNTGTSTGHSATELKKLFVEFNEHRVTKRHLRRGELPQLWRWLPLPVLERAIGNYLIIKAFKPVTAALAERMAA